MLRRAIQLFTLAALVNLVYQYWPRGQTRELILVVNSEDKFGYIDSSGRVRIDFEWDAAFSFDSEGLALVLRDNKSAYIDLSGEEVVPLRTGYLGFFNEFGLAQVMKNRHYSFVNREGEFLTDLTWDSLGIQWTRADYLEADAVSVVRRGADWGLMDSEGKLVMPLQELGVMGFGPQGISPATDGRDWKLINSVGEIVATVEPGPTFIEPFAANGLAKGARSLEPVTNSNSRSFGWINLEGKVVIPLEYEAALDFDEFGTAAVKKDGKWGWIDGQGKEVLPFKWDGADYFTPRGYALVSVDGKWGVIDRQGNTVVAPTWIAMESFDDEGYSQVLKGDKVGIVTERGKVIAEPEWDHVYEFDNHGITWLANHREKVTIDMPSIPPLDMRRVINRAGEEVFEIPEGDWEMLQNDLWRHVGAYALKREVEPGLTRKWMGKVREWLGGEPVPEKEIECICLDLKGNIIWSSIWLSKTTRAWLWLISALLILLVISLLGRKRGKVVKEDP